MNDQRCPCGRGLVYEKCCGAIHAGIRSAVTAEDLMRSRYAAFAKRDEAYLRRSWLPETSPKSIRVRDGRTWTGLKIHDTTGGGAFDRVGTVHFSAHYTDDDDAGTQTENSFFQRLDGAWVYVGPVES